MAGTCDAAEGAGGPEAGFGGPASFGHDEGDAMPTRRYDRAITRGAEARPAAALIPGGLLLLLILP